jgi:hypothetical protein
MSAAVLSLRQEWERLRTAYVRFAIRQTAALMAQGDADRRRVQYMRTRLLALIERSRGVTALKPAI